MNPVCLALQSLVLSVFFPIPMWFCLLSWRDDKQQPGFIYFPPTNTFHPEPRSLIFPAWNSLISPTVHPQKAKSEQRYIYRFIGRVHKNDLEHSYQLSLSPCVSFFNPSLLLLEVLLLTMRERIAPSFFLVTSWHGFPSPRLPTIQGYIL